MPAPEAVNPDLSLPAQRNAATRSLPTCLACSLWLDARFVLLSTPSNSVTLELDKPFATTHGLLSVGPHDRPLRTLLLNSSPPSHSAFSQVSGCPFLAVVRCRLVLSPDAPGKVATLLHLTGSLKSGSPVWAKHHSMAFSSPTLLTAMAALLAALSGNPNSIRASMISDFGLKREQVGQKGTKQCVERFAVVRATQTHSIDIFASFRNRRSAST